MGTQTLSGKARDFQPLNTLLLRLEKSHWSTSDAKLQFLSLHCKGTALALHMHSLNFPICG